MKGSGPGSQREGISELVRKGREAIVQQTATQELQQPRLQEWERKHGKAKYRTVVLARQKQTEAVEESDGTTARPAQTNRVTEGNDREEIMPIDQLRKRRREANQIPAELTFRSQKKKI